MCHEMDHEIPDLEVFGLDEEGPIVAEQLNTVVIPETFEDISEETKDAFLHQLRHISANIGSIDPNVEFLEIKALLIDLLETTSSSESD